ncbi:MAG: ATP-binding protein [Oscillospiraceae bacterium]
MKFIGREKELNALEREYQRNSGFIVVYGRRRVGKTTLIKQFIRGKDALYFLASEESERQNLNQFTEKLADFTRQSFLAQSRFESWLDAFKVLVSYQPEKKKILVIDEFQYLVNGNPAYPSIFQKAWDEILKDNQVTVILCGSLISMMTTQVLSHSSPLYGRRTAQIRLQPLKFQEFREAFPDKSFAELTELYAVTGGVPKYIEFFDNSLSLWENMTDTILNKSGFLYEEPLFLLEKEVREPVNYFSIMKVISMGNHKLAKIAGCLEQKTNSIIPYLSTLAELHLIEKRIPVTEQNPEKSRKGLYYINDWFIAFWFRFVYPYRSELEMDNIGYVLNKIQNSLIENHVSYVFEAISREILITLCMNGQIDFHPSKVGAYWNQHTEIDVVAVDNDNHRIFAGECKYYENPVPADVYFDLKKKCESVPEFQGYEIIYGIFSKSGFEPRLKELQNENLHLINNGCCLS